jgi:DNA-binding SARP family transcriptional activator
MIAFDANLLARPWGGLPGCGEKMSGKLPPWAASWLELPAEGRGIALAAGSVGLVAVGLVALANGSLMGWVYVSLGAAGYVFLHRRLLVTMVWLLVAGIGLAAVVGGELVAGVQVALAAAGIALGLSPGGLSTRHPQAPPAPVGIPAGQGDWPDEAFAGSDGIGLKVKTLGTLRVLDGGTDLAPALLGRPVLSFVWLYLLARGLAQPDGSISRSDLADEVAPGLPSSVQQTRFRSTRHDLVHELPQSLSEVLTFNGKLVAFDLGRCRVDVLRLRGAAEGMARHGGLLGDLQLRQLESLFREVSEGDFLPVFDGLEQEVTSARGVAGQVVASLRRQIAEQRATVAIALAKTYLARNQPEPAIVVLQVAHEQTAREDVVQLLGAAYMQSGQPARARELKRSYQQPAEV